VTYEGRAVVVRDIRSPVLPPVAVNLVWQPDSLLSRATRTFITEAVKLAARGTLGIPHKT
jgi:hypothetical protein